MSVAQLADGKAGTRVTVTVALSSWASLFIKANTDPELVLQLPHCYVVTDKAFLFLRLSFSVSGEK